MASPLEPPPLLEDVDINDEEKISDDLFVSAQQNHSMHFDGYTPTVNNGLSSEVNKINLNEEKDLETVPINTNNLDVLEKLEAESGDQFIEITIKEPQKVGDGMGSYLAYKIITRTNVKLFKNKENIVTRRFSDFLGLHEKLTEKYLKVGRIIPPAPEKNVLGTTKIKMSNQNEAGAQNGIEFVERRRATLERFLNRTAQHPILLVDPDFREFLESDIELPKATNTSALSSAGVMRLFNKVGETVNKITYKMDETDPWFEDKLVHVENLDSQLKKLHSNVEAMVNYRKELANLTSGVSRSAAMLSACEDHPNLSKALSQLADTEEKVEKLHLDQANTDFFILCELLKDYLGLLGAVRDTFHERTKLFQHWHHAQQMLAKKREAKTKLELACRADKLDQAATEVAEWEAKVERGQENFDKISKMIKMEMERFEKCRIQDFKAMFVKYLENHLEHQAKLVKYWEAFLPEARSIA